MSPVMTVTCEATRAERLILQRLSDGEWRAGARTSDPQKVLSTPAAALARRGLVERRGKTVMARGGKGYEYRITGAGLAVLNGGDVTALAREVLARRFGYADADKRLAAAVLAPLPDRMEAMADEILAPLRCTEPAYGAPGIAHCAACCGGTGYVITCGEDDALLDTARVLQLAASMLRSAPPAAVTPLRPDPTIVRRERL